jgi:RNA recognition motif-containing protein
MQENKLFVGNLDYSVTQDELKDLFSSYGSVVSAVVIKNKGFGFVEMSSSDEALNALTELNNHSFKNRDLKIDKAKERKPKNKFIRKGNNGRKTFKKNQ